MTDWEESDQGNDGKVEGMAVRNERGFGIGEVWDREA